MLTICLTFPPIESHSLTQLTQQPSVNFIKQILEYIKCKNHEGSLLQLSGTSTTSSAEASQIGPASVVVGNLVQGNRLAAAMGRDLGLSEESKVNINF